jgi:hypothetical protein
MALDDATEEQAEVRTLQREIDELGALGKPHEGSPLP